MHIAQNWRIRQTRYALKGVRCETCDTVLFPARTVCPHCEAQPVQLPEAAAENRAVLNYETFNPAAHEPISDFAQAAR